MKSISNPAGTGRCLYRPLLVCCGSSVAMGCASRCCGPVQARALVGTSAWSQVAHEGAVGAVGAEDGTAGPHHCECVHAGLAIAGLAVPLNGTQRRTLPAAGPESAANASPRSVVSIVMF